VTANQRAAAYEQLAILRTLEENKSRVNTNEMLDAQNRASQADTAFFEAHVRYMISLKNVHYEKGTLFEYNNIAFVDRGISRRARHRLMSDETVRTSEPVNQLQAVEPAIEPSIPEVSGFAPEFLPELPQVAQPADYSPTR
jgi:hypothetical protein